MKSTIVQKYLSALILVIFIVSQLPYASVYADTDADPNKPVSDLFNKDLKKPIQIQTPTRKNHLLSLRLTKQTSVPRWGIT